MTIDYTVFSPDSAITATKWKEYRKVDESIEALVVEPKHGGCLVEENGEIVFATDDALIQEVVAS